MRIFSMLLASAVVLAMPAAVSAQIIDRNTEALADPFVPGFFTAVVPFYTNVGGTYTFTQTAGFDTFLTIYEGSYNPLDFGENLVLLAEGVGGVAVDDLTLTASIQYFAMLSARFAGDFGPTTLTVTGPAVIMEGDLPSAVPEPATWALMIGGFALAGAGLRRRATSVSYS